MSWGDRLALVAFVSFVVWAFVLVLMFVVRHRHAARRGIRVETGEPSTRITTYNQTGGVCGITVTVEPARLSSREGDGA